MHNELLDASLIKKKAIIIEKNVVLASIFLLVFNPILSILLDDIFTWTSVFIYPLMYILYSFLYGFVVWFVLFLVLIFIAFPFILLAHLTGFIFLHNIQISIKWLVQQTMIPKYIARTFLATHIFILIAFFARFLGLG